MLSFVWLCMCVRGPRGQLMKAEGTPLRPWGLSIALLLGMRLVPPADLYASWRSGRVFHFFNSLPIILQFLAQCWAHRKHTVNAYD